jgi:ribonuclease Z
MELSIRFAGTGGSVPTARRALPAALISAGGDRLLIDCGEGTQRQLLQAGGLPELDAIFLTHFHADHWLGLPGMLKTFDLRGRETELTVYGPPGLHALLDGLRPLIGRVTYPFEAIELDRHEEVGFDEFVVEAVPVDHRSFAYGYALIEDDRPGRFDVDRARELGVPEGPDWGRLQRGEAVGGVTPEQVMGEDRAGRRIVFSGDTRPCQTLEAAAEGADVLVHEATFLHADRARARETGHSTARQAAELARDADVAMLALTHLSTRYFPREIRDEARATFERTVVPRDFDTIEIPFPERGEPHVVRAEDVQPSC